MKKTLFEALCEAIDAGDERQAKELMGDYCPAKMRTAYKVIEKYDGYTAACAARRGEHTYTGHKYLGLE
jgi:hypothetical protein